MIKRYFPPAFILIIFIFILLSCSNYGKKDILKAGFINPPDSALPGVFWYFLNGNTDMEGITADLESMKEAGIGYVLLHDVSTGFPPGNSKFLSEQWFDCFRHAIRECERLNLRLIIGSGPGMAGSGGPWITPERSMMQLLASDTVVTGPASFVSELPLPKHGKPAVDENYLTPALKKSIADWYTDVRILAFPTPSGSERIRDIDRKAFHYRTPLSLYQGYASDNLNSSAYSEDRGSAIQKGKIIDLTNYLRKDGRLEWLVPPGKWTVVRLGARTSGTVTRLAPEPGFGLEADKFDTTALKIHYEAYVAKLIEKSGRTMRSTGGGWTMLHLDRWISGSQNWSNGFIEQFIKRRGYDPLLFLPVYKGYIINSTQESERFLWDVRQTVNELIIDNNADYLRKLGQKNGFSLSVEHYGTDLTADLDLGAAANVPMAGFGYSMPGYDQLISCLESSSVAHVAGKPVIAAKAFASDNAETWKKDTGETKNLVDWALTMGINRIFFDSFPLEYQGDQVLPGKIMAPAGGIRDSSQTILPVMTEYNKYISRCQLVLSQGSYVADILYLTPEGAPQVFAPPRSALDNPDSLPDKKGYSFDACSPKYFIANASVINSRISFPGGTSYRILVLPDIKTMTPELLAKIDLIARTGGFVIGYPPESSPSLAGYPVADRNIHEVAEKMWGSNREYSENVWKPYANGMILSPMRGSTNEISGEKGELYPEYRVTAGILDSIGLKEDFISSGNLRYTHRSLPDREIYFISNRTGAAIEDSCIFRNGTENAELWDPMTGEIRPVRSFVTYGPKVARVRIKMEPWQSYFVVFYHLPLKNSTRFEDSDYHPVQDGKEGS